MQTVLRALRSVHTHTHKQTAPLFLHGTQHLGTGARDFIFVPRTELSAASALIFYTARILVHPQYQPIPGLLKQYTTICSSVSCNAQHINSRTALKSTAHKIGAFSILRQHSNICWLKVVDETLLAIDRMSIYYICVKYILSSFQLSIDIVWGRWMNYIANHVFLIAYLWCIYNYSWWVPLLLFLFTCALGTARPLCYTHWWYICLP
jgi:hypothetical protein